MFTYYKTKLMFGLLTGAAMMAVIACGGDTETITIRETVIVPGDTVVQTVVVTEKGDDVVVTATPVGAAPADAPKGNISAPTPNTDAGVAVIAMGGEPFGDENGRNANQSSDSLKNWGIAETLFRRAPDDTELPWLASSFTIKPDLSGATVKIQTGVSFQVVDGYNPGDMTAHDVAWSMNDHNSTTNPESIGGQAGDFAGLWGEWTAVDDTTITFDFVNFDSTWKDDYVNQSGQAFSVFSKKAFEDKGEDWVADNIVATGPFQIEEWLRDESFTVVNRPGTHWLADIEPKAGKIKVVQVAEGSTRLALLRTGDVDAAFLAPKDAMNLDLSSGWTQTDSGAAEQHGLFFAGNLWEDTFAGGPNEGEPLPVKATFVHDIPWIGSPGKHGDDDMEQARDIRKALALAIDKELINESLTGGLGRVVEVQYFSVSHPNWTGEHEYAYDPDEAQRLIMAQDADYQKGSASKDGPLGANAFEISIYAQGGLPIRDEIAAAVAGFWNDIGLTTYALKFSYQTFRPTIVGRTNTHPWVTACDKGNEAYPWHFPKGLVQTTLTRGGFGCGFESPKIVEFYQRMAEATDTASATQAANEYLDYVYEWNLQPGIIALPDSLYYNNNKIKSYVMDKAAMAPFNSLWNVELK